MSDAADKGKQDAEKQIEHQKEGHDVGILDTILDPDRKCEYDPPDDPEEKEEYDDAFWREMKR